MIGHRKSNETDLFTTLDFDAEDLLEKIKSDFTFYIDFLAHKYPMINEIQNIEGLRIASMDDIAAMKVNSVSNDGTRVIDFIKKESGRDEMRSEIDRACRDYIRTII
ncbi:MAG TPA: hypothetical protein ENO05_02940 [Bacteroides sp.]|nr:hypothetical protein [Bacteroides sp.]